jgi:hypothetical protein
VSGVWDSVADLLLDTDVLIDVLRGARCLTVTGHRIAYSVVTRAELFSGRAKDEEEVRSRNMPADSLVPGSPCLMRSSPRPRSSTGSSL